MKSITFTLSNDDALVIFGLLSRWTETQSLGPPDEIFAHSSEKQALHNLLCVLESNLTEPLLDSYVELLNEARNRVGEFPHPF